MIDGNRNSAEPSVAFFSDRFSGVVNEAHFLYGIHERADPVVKSPDAHHGTVDYLGQLSTVEGGATVPQTPLGLLGRNQEGFRPNSCGGSSHKTSQR